MCRCSWMTNLLCPGNVQALHLWIKIKIILTDNLKIIANNKLHKCFSKNPKYRENRIADYEKEAVISSINEKIR